MSLKDLTEPKAVRAAIEEFDVVGREAFLSRYGFKPATRYWVAVGEKEYDAKAIAGVAHQHQHGVLLGPREFQSGEGTVVACLEGLGFTVVRGGGKREWTYPELILALELYLRLRHRGVRHSRTHPEVRRLSDELRALPIYSREVRARENFRNTASVSAKLDNFDHHNPDHPGGWPKGGAPTGEVWEQWAHRRNELAAAAETIRAYRAEMPAPPAQGHPVRSALAGFFPPRQGAESTHQDTAELEAVPAAGAERTATGRPTFLLTQNPAKWTWPEGEEQAFIANSRAGVPSPDLWSTGSRRGGVRPGDRALLLRQGAQPRGLLASGTFTSEVHEAPHWNGSGATTWAADVQWEVFLDATELLPVAVLQEATPGYAWQPQASGQILRTDVADTAWALWEEHTADLRPAAAPPQDSDGTGQGRVLDPMRRKALEDAAQHRLETYYRDRGWDVEDVRFEGPYDAIARKNGQIRYLEAKGTQSTGDSVTVTAGEVAHARRHPGECVIGILSGVRFTDDGDLDDSGAHFALRRWKPAEEDLQAIQYRWDATRTPTLPAEDPSDSPGRS